MDSPLLDQDACLLQRAEDFAVVGVDENPMAEFFRVPVTVIRQRPYEIGGCAAKLLVELIQQPDTEGNRILAPCRLVKRDACKNPVPAARD